MGKVKYITLHALFAFCLLYAGRIMAQYNFNRGGHTGTFDQDVTDDLTFDINSAEKCRITTNGRISCLTGGQPGGADTTCSSAADAGTIRYLSTIQLCDGTEWINVDGSSSGTPCTNDATVECVLEATRSNDDLHFIAGNIKNGITILGVTGTLLSGTACDIYSFDFTALTDVATSTLFTSDIVQVQTDTCSADVAVSGGGSPEYRICNNATCSAVDHTWATSGNSIDNNQYVQVRLTSSASAGVTNTANLTLSAVRVNWDVTTQPPPKIVFATSTTSNGNLGGMTGANTTCNTLASAAGLTGTFKAWLSTSTSDDPESTFTQSANGYETVTAVKIADNWADLVSGDVDNPINVDENGATISGEVWTNVNTNGTRTSSTKNCNDWTDGSSGFSPDGYYGDSTASNGWWTNKGFTDGCDASMRIYCFEQ